MDNRNDEDHNLLSPIQSPMDLSKTTRPSSTSSTESQSSLSGDDQPAISQDNQRLMTPVRAATSSAEFLINHRPPTLLTAESQEAESQEQSRPDTFNQSKLLYPVTSSDHQHYLTTSDPLMYPSCDQRYVHYQQPYQNGNVSSSSPGHRSPLSVDIDDELYKIQNQKRQVGGATEITRLTIWTSPGSVETEPLSPHTNWKTWKRCLPEPTILTWCCERHWPGSFSRF